MNTLDLYKEKVEDNTHLTGNSKLLDQLFEDPKFFIETFLYIKNKNGKTVPFTLNSIQKKYLKIRGRFNIVLKARQIGMSTILLADEFRKSVLFPGTNVLLIAQDSDTTTRMFETMKLFYNNLPDYIKPPKKYSNRKELYFSDDKHPEVSLNSRLFISSPGGTSGGNTVGRSATINTLHMTEAAFWNNLQEVLSGLLESTPITEESTSIVLESTPNGQNYYFNLYQLAKSGKSMFQAIFFPWFENDEYRLKLDPKDNFDTYVDEDEREYVEKLKVAKEALKWRRTKMSFYAKDAINEFRKEYPKDDISCFLTFNTASTFPEKAYLYLATEISDPVEKYNIFKMKDFKAWEEFDPTNYYIISIDPAEGHEGSDLTAMEVFKIENESTLTQVCEYASRVSPVEIGKVISTITNGLSNYMVVWERNTGSAIEYILAQFGVSNLYMHTDGYAGFPMNRISRPVIISKFLNSMIKKEVIIKSDKLYQEIQMFKETDKEARMEDGSHFDRLFSTMILNSIIDKLGNMEAEISSINLDNFEGINI